MKNKELIRTIKFTLFSISAGIVQWVLILLCNEVFKLPNNVSWTIGTVCSVIWNLTINRRFTFKSANNVPIAMLETAIFYVIFIPLSNWLIKLMTDAGMAAYIADIIATLLNFVLEFLYQRFFVFRKSIDTNDIAKREQEKEMQQEKTDTDEH